MYHSSGSQYAIRSQPVSHRSYASEVLVPQMQKISYKSPSFLPQDSYNGVKQRNGYYTQPMQDSHAPEFFLKPDRPVTGFINTSEEVQSIVEEAFEKLTGKKLQNVIIAVCTRQEMAQRHPNWHPGILGFARNFAGMQAAQICVTQDYLDRMIVTIGHELGHVFTLPRDKIHDEEAKAFAFEFAWVKTIKEHNIGNLSQSLTIPLPASNGLHDKAFSFVINRINEGKDAYELYWDIVMEKSMLEILLSEL